MGKWTSKQAITVHHDKSYTSSYGNIKEGPSPGWWNSIGEITEDCLEEVVPLLSLKAD